MRRKVRQIFTFVAALICFGFVLPRGHDVMERTQSKDALPADFSADFVLQAVPNTLPAPQMKLYVSGGKMRLEIHSGGLISIDLFDFVQDHMWALDPQQKLVLDLGKASSGESEAPFVFPFPPYDLANLCSGSLKSDETCVRAGQEVVDGRRCDKWILQSPEAGHQESSMCFDVKLRFPLRSVNSKGVIEVRKVEEGAQPANLFEIPADFHKPGEK